jgi:predicted ester cyclase
MKLMKFFSVRRNSLKEDAVAVSSGGGAGRQKEEMAKATKEEQAATTTRRRSSSGGGGAQKNNDKIKKDAKYGVKAIVGAETTTTTTTTAIPALTVQTPNEEVVVQFFNNSSSGDHDLLQYFTNDADWIFQEAHMTMPGFVAEMEKVFQSFPDFQFQIHSVQEQPDDGNTVLVRVNAVGTHTGLPFAFGPYPEIPATGIRVTMDHEYVSVPPQQLLPVLRVLCCV